MNKWSRHPNKKPPKWPGAKGANDERISEMMKDKVMKKMKR